MYYDLIDIAPTWSHDLREAIVHLHDLTTHCITVADWINRGYTIRPILVLIGLIYLRPRKKIITTIVC